MKACPTNCGAFARDGHLLCPKCWSSVPALLQRAVNTTWRAHQAPGIVPGALTSYRRASELARVSAELARGAAKLVVAAAPVPWPWILLHTACRVLPCELPSPAPGADVFVALLQRDIDNPTLQWVRQLGDKPDTAQREIRLVARLVGAEEGNAHQESWAQGQPVWRLADPVALPKPVLARADDHFFIPAGPLLSTIREQYRRGHAELAAMPRTSRRDYDWSNQ